MVTKTRDKLIEVARQLFAHKGIENTTMNDIATASDKGRRTIYTYFKNKREIYNAVIERESEHLVSRLKEVVTSPLPPVEKLRRYLTTRFEIVNDTVQGRDNGGAFRSFFSRDFRRIERIRRLAVGKEQEMFATVINEGVSQGVFDPRQAGCATSVETMIFQGVDYSHLRDNFDEIGVSRTEMRDDVIEFIIKGILKK